MASKSPDGERETQSQGEATVGYCRPPKHAQFKPGQSGNARGRPRRKLVLNNIVEELATMPVTVTVDGHARKMPALRAILMLELRKALQGDSKASRFVLEVFESRGLGGAVKGSQDDLTSQAAGAKERLLQAVEAALNNNNSNCEGTQKQLE